MGSYQSTDYSNQVEERNRRRSYNEALYKTLLSRLKYIQDHNPHYHGNFKDYYSKINNYYNEDLFDNYYDVVTSSKKARKT